jgi:hypothetical protein
MSLGLLVNDFFIFSHDFVKTRFEKPWAFHQLRRQTPSFISLMVHSCTYPPIKNRRQAYELQSSGMLCRMASAQAVEARMVVE